VAFYDSIICQRHFHLGQQRFLPLDLLELNNFFPTMTTSIRVRFAGLHRQYTAVPWNIPNHPYPFQPIPADATSIVVPTGGIFINGQGHRLPEKLTLDEAPTWGYNDDENDTEIIFAQATSPTSRFCLRMVLDVNKVIRDKKSKRYRTLSRLVKDAKFHSTYLAYAEGLMMGTGTALDRSGRFVHVCSQSPLKFSCSVVFCLTQAVDHQSFAEKSVCLIHIYVYPDEKIII
jgi:hypothetical protein